MERFWQKVDIREPDQCWEWKATKNQSGYGSICVDGKMKRAHRVSYELHHGPIPEGMLVLHSCDNPSCVNPAHLHLGTHQDNMREKMNRRRCHNTACEAHGQAKLTSDQVQQIRTRYAAGGVTQKQLAEEFGVARSQIWRVVRMKGWLHV